MPAPGKTTCKAGMGVGDGVIVAVGVKVGVAVFVAVGVEVGVCEAVGVNVLVGVNVGVGVKVNVQRIGVNVFVTSFSSCSVGQGPPTDPPHCASTCV